MIGVPVWEPYYSAGFWNPMTGASTIRGQHLESDSRGFDTIILYWSLFKPLHYARRWDADGYVSLAAVWFSVVATVGWCLEIAEAIKQGPLHPQALNTYCKPPSKPY